MQAFQKICSHLAKGVAPGIASRYSPGSSKGFLLHPFQRFTWTPLWKASAPFCQSQQPKDYGLPNRSWRQVMVDQFEKFMAMSKDGTWRKIPHCNHFVDIIPESMKKDFMEGKQNNTRYFLRSIEAEGLGFEFVSFFNASEKRMMSIFQPGVHLAGPAALVHGGAVAAILDHTFSNCAFYSLGKMTMTNLRINYKSPVFVESVVLVDTKVDRMEGNQLFMSGHIQSAEGRGLHVEATAQLVQMDSKTSPQEHTHSE